MKKLSARNQLKGKIVEVKNGVTISHVRIDIGNGLNYERSRCRSQS
jgi:molybdopterin-binding protein